MNKGKEEEAAAEATMSSSQTALLSVPATKECLFEIDEGGRANVKVFDSLEMRAAFLHFCSSSLMAHEMHMAPVVPQMSAQHFTQMIKEIKLLEPDGPLSILSLGFTYATLKSDEDRGLHYSSFLDALLELAFECGCNVATKMLESYAEQALQARLNGPTTRGRAHVPSPPDAVRSSLVSQGGGAPIRTRAPRFSDAASRSSARLSDACSPLSYLNNGRKLGGERSLLDFMNLNSSEGGAGVSPLGGDGEGGVLTGVDLSEDSPLRSPLVSHISFGIGRRMSGEGGGGRGLQPTLSISRSAVQPSLRQQSSSPAGHDGDCVKNGGGGGEEIPHHPLHKAAVIISSSSDARPLTRQLSPTRTSLRSLSNLPTTAEHSEEEDWGPTPVYTSRDLNADLLGPKGPSGLKKEVSEPSGIGGRPSSRQWARADGSSLRASPPAPASGAGAGAGPHRPHSRLGVQASFSSFEPFPGGYGPSVLARSSSRVSRARESISKADLAAYALASPYASSGTQKQPRPPADGGGGGRQLATRQGNRSVKRLPSLVQS